MGWGTCFEQTLTLNTKADILGNPFILPGVAAF